MMREISKTLLNLDELLGAKRKKRETCPIRNDLQNNRSAKEKKVVARGSRRRIKVITILGTMLCDLLHQVFAFVYCLTKMLTKWVLVVYVLLCC